MATFKVITDGSLDVPEEILQKYDIPVVQPLVIIDGEEFRSRVDITLEEFFERQRTSATLPKTSQPAPGQFVEAFEEALKDHERVLYIGISSGLSGTFNSAQQAAAQFDEGKIVLHDTLSITGEGGLQVVAAARIAELGGTLEDAQAAAKQIQGESRLFFTLDDLTFLIKGGRVGRVAGAVGSFLNLKPIITVDKEDGRFQPHSRIRTFKAAVRKMVDLTEESLGAGTPGRFLITYGETVAEARALEEELRRRFDVRWLYIGTAGPTLGAHVGPRALALAFAPGDW